MEDPRAAAEIDALVAAFFAAFDNRGGAAPDLARLAGLFIDHAVVARGSATGAQAASVQEFAAPRIALLTDGSLRDFHEHEVSAVTQCFGSIATRTSRYAKSGVRDGRHYAGTGTKCFQLVCTPAGWRIAALAWADDDA